MTFILYMLLLAAVLIGVGGALIARGWWLDKAAGNHKRARCRKCWYSLEATAAREDGTTLCPECGTVARRAADLHRVRRGRVAAAAGVVMICGGMYLGGRPYLANGGWLYLLPRSVAAKLWAWAEAEQYGREVRMRVAQGVATDAEIESVAGGAKAMVIRAAKNPNGAMTGDVEAAFRALVRDGADAQVEAAACALMLQPGPFYSKPAIAYLDGVKTPMRRRIELGGPLLARLGSPPTEYFDMLKDSNDPDALAELARAAQMGGVVGGWAKNDLIQTKAAGLLAIAAAFRGAKSDAGRESAWDLFEHVAPFHYCVEVVPFVNEVGAIPAFAERAQRLALSLSGRVEVKEEQIKPMLESGKPVEVATACRAVERLSGLPEGCGAIVLRLRDSGDEAMQTATQQLIYRFSGADRLLWVERLTKGDDESRREACFVVRNMSPRLREAVAVLREMESSSRESEDVRVSARDALRQMGEWKRE